MNSIPPKPFLFLVESGWSADIDLPLTVDVINGMRGRNGIGKQARSGNQDFHKIRRLITAIQESGTMAFGIFKGKNQEMTVIFFLGVMFHRTLRAVSTN